jgi:hypothetical protein
VSLEKGESESCKVCKFFRLYASTKGVGECARYPQRVEVTAGYWCGDFKRKQDEVDLTE